MPAVTEVRDAQRASWNKFSAGWKKWDTLMMNFLSPVGEAMIQTARLSPADNVLDVASGTGEPGLTAARKVTQGSVLAVDVAEEMVKVANEKAAKAGIKNFKAQPFDGFSLPGGDYDVVLVRFGIMFFPDMGAGVRELKRILKPGGRVAAGVWQTPPENPWASLPAATVFEALKIPPPPPDSPGMFRCAPAGLAVDLFKSAGFKNVEEKTVAQSVTFESETQYWEMLNDVAQPVVVNLAKADDATKEKVRQTVMQKISPFKKGNALTFPWAAKVISGEA